MNRKKFMRLYQQGQKALSPSRRSFLRLAAVSGTGLALLRTGNLAADNKALPTSARQNRTKSRISIFQDKAHFNLSDSLPAYRAPERLTANQKYLDRIDHETFLKRHWFA